MGSNHDRLDQQGGYTFILVEVIFFFFFLFEQTAAPGGEKTGLA